MSSLTAGVIITDLKKTKILSCIPYGKKKLTDHCRDIPKGHLKEGETAIEAAIRELKEETGIVVQSGELLDLGEQQYYRSKSIHLFHLRRATLPEIESLHCESTFLSYGRAVPEMIGYEYLDLTSEVILEMFYFVLGQRINSALNLS